VVQPPEGERWRVVRTAQGGQRARTTLAHAVEQACTLWETRLWHLGNQRFARAPNAQAAPATQLKTCHAWLVVHADVHIVSKYAQSGRPHQDAIPDHLEWQDQATFRVNAETVAPLARRRDA
jgi:hypothetical protein